MPKRKYSDKDIQDLSDKLRKIEKEVARGRTKKRRRVRVISSSSSSSRDSSASRSKSKDRRSSTLGKRRKGNSSSRADLCRPSDVVPSEQSPPAPAEPPAAVTESPPAVVSAESPPCPVEPTQVPDDPLAVASPDGLEGNAGLNDTALELDSDILEILGVDPTRTDKYGKDLQKDLAIRFEHCATVGLSKDDRKQLTDRYLVPGNCKLIDSPILNPETKAALSEFVVKKDKAIEAKQKVMASAISSLGEAISLLMASKDKNTEILRLLMDAGKLFCDCQYNDSVTRRNFILYSVKKEMKESLLNTKIDSLLFGNNLIETLKTAKAINKSAAELKLPAASKPATTSKKNLAGTSKNWKNLNQFRKQPAKKKETTQAITMTKKQRATFSRSSQSHRASHNRR